MKNQLLFAVGITALSTAATILAKRSLFQNKYKNYPSQIAKLHAFSNDTCRLKNRKNFPPNASDLAFIIANENRILPICFTQYDDDEFSNHRVYSDSFSQCCKKNVGCTVSYMTSLHGYGTMDGIIYCGEFYETEPAPHFNDELCRECITSIICMSKPCDVLLCDMKAGVLYDLYGNYRFSIRNYEIMTHVNWDRTINISILDKDLRAVEKSAQAVWKKSFGKFPKIRPNREYFVIPEKLVIK